MNEATLSETGIEHELAEARAQLESLRATFAEAEAQRAAARTELEETSAAYAASQSDLSQTRAEVDQVRSLLREAALKYREAKLSGSPDVLPDLVPEAESLEEVDRGFEAAQRVAARLRERLEQERQAMRVPAGAPLRRAADLSTLSPVEKIKAGLAALEAR